MSFVEFVAQALVSWTFVGIALAIGGAAGFCICIHNSWVQRPAVLGWPSVAFAIGWTCAIGAGLYLLAGSNVLLVPDSGWAYRRLAELGLPAWLASVVMFVVRRILLRRSKNIAYIPAEIVAHVLLQFVVFVGLVGYHLRKWLAAFEAGLPTPALDYRLVWVPAAGTLCGALAMLACHLALSKSEASDDVALATASSEQASVHGQVAAALEGAYDTTVVLKPISEAATMSLPVQSDATVTIARLD